MKIKQLVYTLFVVIALSTLAVWYGKFRWEDRREHSYGLTSDSMPVRVFLKLNVKSKQVKIKPDSDYLGIINLPAKDSVFRLNFDSDINLCRIKIEDVKGTHYMFNLRKEVYDDGLYKQDFVDSLNLHHFWHQDNQFYEISQLSKKLFCKIKANPLRTPRIMFISLSGYSDSQTLAIIQEGKR